jgi:hypothetical protein
MVALEGPTLSLGTIPQEIRSGCAGSLDGWGSTGSCARQGRSRWERAGSLIAPGLPTRRRSVASKVVVGSGANPKADSPAGPEGKRVVKGSGDQDVSRERPDRPQPSEDLEKTERATVRCVCDGETGAIPAAAVLPGSFTIERRLGVTLLHDTPCCSHVREECRVRAGRSNSLLLEHRSRWKRIQGVAAWRGRHGEL